MIFLLLILISVSHANIIRYCNRPFLDIDDMDRKLIQNWQNTVSETDTVYMLGDFALTGREYCKSILSQLPGYKVLVYGNHDHMKPNQYLEAGFNEVNKRPIVFNGEFILSHAPLPETDYPDLINIYGHIHDHPLSRRAKSFCVSVERIDYKPISYKEIKARMNI